MLRSCTIALSLLLAAAALSTGGAVAQEAGPSEPATASEPTTQTAGQLPAEMEGEVGIDERFGARVPMDLPFRDESGAEVTLGAYFGQDKPVVLAFVYHNCPMLCSLILDGLTAAVADTEVEIGEEYTVLVVSFEPEETPELARSVEERYLKRFPAERRANAEAGIHYLTGPEASVTELTRAIGFNYRWDERRQEYAHTAALTFLTPRGEVARYLYGIAFPERDWKKAMIEAGQGTIGSPVDRLLMYCFQYDAEARSYTPVVVNIMKLGGGLTLLGLAIGLGGLWLQERRRNRRAAAAVRGLDSEGGHAQPV